MRPTQSALAGSGARAGSTLSSRTLIATGLGLAATGVAAALAWAVVGVNMERACTVQDTPYLDLCQTPAPGSEAHLASLRARIAANPGDAAAYVQLSMHERAPRQDGALRAAWALAPAEPNVLTRQAAAALQAQDWPRAVPLLVDLVEYRFSGAAAQALAQLIVSGRGQLLQAHITRGSRWFGQVIGEMANSKAPFSAALPLVATAVKNGVIEIDTVRAYIRQLKAAGAWVDAYSLWVSLHPKAIPLLYNASFDQPFQPDGFDWEPAQDAPSRTGARIDRLSVQDRGFVLDIEFTGRPLPTPLVRQYVFLGPGRYALAGDYQARQLRVEQGLVWSVRCGSGSEPVWRSAPLADTEGRWRPFSAEFEIPAHCGPIASLQLEAFATLGALGGGRGRMAFDGLALRPLRR